MTGTNETVLVKLLFARGYAMAIVTNQEVLESGFEKIATRANTLPDWVGFSAKEVAPLRKGR